MSYNKIVEYFDELETTREYNGYLCTVTDAVAIILLGSICGLKTVKQISDWASNEKISEILKEKFAIKYIPCYYWLLCLLKIVKTESLNRCFAEWVYSFMPEKAEKITIALDGKTICSTTRKESPLHIISAQISELGLTLAQRSVDEKSNEIPAVQALLKELKLKDTMVTADALNCQKETAEIIVEQKADYLLSVKENQPNLKKDIEDYVQDEVLRKEMDSYTTIESGHGRIEKRSAYVSTNIEWLYGKNEWKKLACIGAIHKEVDTKSKQTAEWHYYISSRKLSAKELLHHARMEWAVETMHWMLDVHFREDWCRVEDRTIQQNLNMFRKAALNIVKLYVQRSKSSKSTSRIMFDCLIDPAFLCDDVLL